MNFKQQQEHIKAVISTTSRALVDKALHMSITYNSNDLVTCIKKMTNKEWETWSNQPAIVKSAYLEVMNQEMVKEITQLAFNAKRKKQLKEVATTFERT